MDKQIRRIGVLTSGGDAPGMNAVIRSVVRTASAYDISVLGIRRGYSGLINGDIIEMGARSVDGIIRRGGTMLYTARCKEMLTEEGLQKAADTCKYLGIDGLICCGGDGTFRGAQALSRKGVPCIGVPGTIDNDIGLHGLHDRLSTPPATRPSSASTSCATPCSRTSAARWSRSWAAARAIWRCTSAVRSARPRSACRSAKLDFDTWTLSRRCASAASRAATTTSSSWRRATAPRRRLPTISTKPTGIDTRVTILGHIQRGGSPTAQDRVMATRMGYAAVRALMEGKTNRVVVFDNNMVTDLDIEEGLSRQKDLNQCLFEAQQTVAI